MADGPTEPEPDDGGRPEEGRVLSPEELDFTDSENVEQIDEDRFVVSSDASGGGVPSEAGQSREASGTDGGPSPDQAPSPGSGGSEPSQSADQPREAGELTDERVHEWLRESFEQSRSRYGFDVTATFDGSVSQRRMASNDVVTIFESLVLWYAQQVDTDTPVEEVLGILLMEANVPIRYPPESLKSLVTSAGLGPDDTIADLLAAVEAEDGVKL